MYIFNQEFPIGLVIFVTIIVLSVLTGITISIVKPIVENHRYRKTTKAAIAEEEDRITKLPRLSTRYLIRIPASVSNFAKGEPRTFGNRYNRLIVFDENGDGWLGLFMPETFRGLHDGEYV